MMSMRKTAVFSGGKGIGRVGPLQEVTKEVYLRRKAHGNRHGTDGKAGLKEADVQESRFACRKTGHKPWNTMIYSLL